ncbi:Hemicentin-2 [Collichthys lucidus]|uniref:Hemicentin-2 n=2 Tax=Sciaenidae TaxID=30870 RepID=A0A4U5VU37_COLLU|nr:Hemicentin-2 [Collichthys lucidus]
MLLPVSWPASCLLPAHVRALLIKEQTAIGPSEATLPDYSTYASMGGAKGLEVERHNNILAGPLDQLRPWGELHEISTLSIFTVPLQKAHMHSRNDLCSVNDQEKNTILGMEFGLTQCCGASCPIELNPPIVVLRYGQSVSINCSTSESESDGMGWEATQGGKSLQPVKHLTWTVEALTDWNISPVCYLNLPPDSQFGEQCSANPKVVLYTFPETISISPDSDGALKEAEEYNFTCNINNIAPVKNLIVTWYKGDTIIYTDTFKNPSKKPVNQTSVLGFTPHRQDEGVTFRCEAHLDLQPEGPQLHVSSQEYTITVNYGPDIECSDMNVLELLEGETLESHCPVTGKPFPYIKWEFNGQPVDPSVPLTRENKGNYTVEAEGRSFASRTLQVAVLYGPELECPHNYTAVEDTLNGLTCTVKGYPKPKIIWYKDDEEVELPENLTRSDAGQYSVTALNTVSVVNVTVDILVLYPPSQIVELEDSEVSVGSTISLKCFSRGNPRPIYSWNYYRTHKVTVENEDGVSLLIIHNATGYNAGFYTCRASNTIGNVSKTVRVTVKVVFTLELLLLLLSLSNGTRSKTPDSVSIRLAGNLSSVVEESEFQLQCDIINVAPARNLTVLWYKGNETIKSDTNDSLQVTGCLPKHSRDCDINAIRSALNVSSTISITLNREHSGAEFRCMAKLDLEPTEPQRQLEWTSSPLNITVYYKPSINTTKLPKTIPVFRGYPEDLICEADGYPPPKIEWLYSSDNVHSVSGNMLTVSEAGFYRCQATNDIDIIIHEVEVILKGKPVTSSCPVELNPPRAAVKYKDPFSANCISKSNQTESMGWESTNGGVPLTVDVTSLSLNITSVTDWKLEPKCFINFQDGDQCLSHLTVVVYKMPDSVSMSEPSVLIEGRNYSMRCDIKNVAPAKYLSVHWRKGNRIIHTETFDDDKSATPVNKSSVVNVTARGDDDGTPIRCEVRLSFWPDAPSLPPIESKSHQVTVLYSPIFFSPANEEVELKAGTKIELNCTARGNPMPAYGWTLPHDIQRRMKDQSTNQSILTPSFELPGTYTCTVSNSQGTKTKRFTVTEPAIPCRVAKLVQGGIFSLSPLNRLLGAENNMGNNFLQWILTLCMFYTVSGEGCSLILKPSRVVVGFGEPVSVSCEATRPVRVLGWESAISAAHTQQDLSVQWKVDSLIDWIEEPICYGVFFTAPRQCEEKLNLVLYKTPDSVSIRPANHTGPMVEGKEYQLLCEVQNIAPVQYLTLRWYRGQTEVYNHSFSDLTSSSPVQVSSILVITPTKAENGAQYRCVAVLELGPEGPQPPPTVTSEPLNASVYFPPTFLSPEPEILDYIVGDEITLNCTATGNPPPVYSWQSSHPIQERMEDEAALTSSSLLPGTYTCTASNALEKKSKQFIVKAKTKGMPQKDPCQKQACAIQTCLQANKYVESMCEDVIREMRRCCEVHAGHSICCSGFKDSPPAKKSNT